MTQQSNLDRPAGPILIVDDDPISRELARYILDRHGYATVAVDSSKAAQRALMDVDPSLILMDIHLGQGSGIAVVTALRKGYLGKKRDVPVIYVTGDHTPLTATQAIGPTIQGYILKPYSPALLIAKVREAYLEMKAAPTV